MTSLLREVRDIVPPTQLEAELATESSRKLSQFVNASPQAPLRITIESEGGGEESIMIPGSAMKLLNEVLTEMARGNAVTLIPIQAELTTRQASDILNVSRPFLINQLEQGAIPFRKVGTHRRILFQDLLAYKRKMDQNRQSALKELSAIDQELGLGY